MERYELPEGWKLYRLEELAEIHYGSGLPAKKRNNLGSVPVYGSNGIVGKHDSSITDAPAIIIGRKGSVGAVNFSLVPCWPIDTAFFIDIFPENVSADWLFLFLSTCDLAHFNQEGPKPGIRRDDLYTVRIPIPPLPDQRRIVTRIEELTRRVEETRKARTVNLENISRLLLSAMETCFQGDDGWIEKTLNELCVMKTGKTPPTSHSEYFNGDIPFVCPADVGERLFISDALRRLSVKAVEDRKATVFEKGTVLLVCIGSTVGKVGLAARRLCTNQQLTGLVFNDRVLPEYAAWFLTQQRETIRNASAGGGVPIINQNGVGQLSMRFPEDKAEQHRIVGYLNGLQNKAEDLKQLQAETEAELAAFTPALLAKAFRGEL